MFNFQISSLFYNFSFITFLLVSLSTPAVDLFRPPSSCEEPDLLLPQKYYIILIKI